MNKRFFNLSKCFNLGIFLILVVLFLHPVSLFSQELKWKFYTGGNIESSPSVGEDGTIYFCVSQNSQYILYALNPDGTKKWEFISETGSRGSSPCIGPDETIYFGLSDSNFYAINPDGSLKWKFSAGCMETPSVNPDNTIYLSSSRRTFHVLMSDGSLKWELVFDEGTLKPSVTGEDGTIYLCKGSLFAYNPGGTKNWEYMPNGNITSSPSIDSDGTLYFGTYFSIFPRPGTFIPAGYFYAVNPDGTTKWKFDIGGSSPLSSSIGPDGTIYFGYNYLLGTIDDFRLFALNPNGTLKWDFHPGGNIDSVPAIGSDGTIYFGCDDGIFYALNSDGTLKWEFITGDEIKSSPAIASDGTIYFSSNDGYFYAISSDSQGLAESPWPKYHHDNQSTGSIQSSKYSAPIGELEAPDTSKLYYREEIIEVFGWALSFAGILKVEIYINDVYQADAELGIPRDDIYQRYPEYDNRNSGFKWIWNIQDVPRGEYTIEAIAFDVLGRKASLGKREIAIFKW